MDKYFRELVDVCWLVDGRGGVGIVGERKKEKTVIVREAYGW